MNEYQVQRCSLLIEDLMKSPMTVPLRAPVDPVKDGVPDYLKIIKKPMDLGRIKRNLKTMVYGSIDDFYNDIKLVCDNAKLFNGAESMLGFVADDIMKMADEWRADNCSCIEEQWFKEQQKGLKLLEKHVKSAPSCITNEPEIELPDDVKIDDLDEENKKKVKDLLVPFEKEDIKNIWAFIENDKRKQILEILNVKKEE